MKKMFADVAGKLTSIPFREILEHCEAYSRNYRIEYLDILMIKIYIDAQKNDQNLEELFKELSRSEQLKIYIGRTSEIARETHCNMATILLGLYSGKVVTQPKLLEDYASIVILEILGAMNDTDIEHFSVLYEYLTDSEENFVVPHQAYYRSTELKPESYLLEQLTMDPKLASYLSSTNKLLSIGLFSRGAGMWGSVDNVTVTTNIYSHIINELILEYQELLDLSKRGI